MDPNLTSGCPFPAQFHPLSTCPRNHLPAAKHTAQPSTEYLLSAMAQCGYVGLSTCSTLVQLAVKVSYGLFTTLGASCALAQMAHWIGPQEAECELGWFLPPLLRFLHPVGTLSHSPAPITSFSELGLKISVTESRVMEGENASLSNEAAPDSCSMLFSSVAWRGQEPLSGTNCGEAMTSLQLLPGRGGWHQLLGGETPRTATA